jgi:glycosyltransferase involved in cell wall biosynthesis
LKNSDKKTKVRLLAVAGAFQTSGGMAVVARLIMRTILEKQGKNDHLIVCCFSEFEPFPPKKLNFRYKGRFTYKVFCNNKYKFAAYILKYFFFSRLELMFFDYINLAAFMGIFGYLKMAKYYVWVHGLEAYPPNPGMKGILGIKGSYYNLCGTEFTKKSVEKNIKGIKLNVCYLALEPELSFIPEKSTLIESICFKSSDGIKRPLGNKVILFVGRMDASQQHKGQDTLILAFPRIKKEIPEGQLVLAGKGEDINRLCRLALSLSEDCQKSIFFPGFVTEDLKQQLYSQCYCFAMPSQKEGFGLVYLEAMRWGKPCLGSATDAASSVIQDGKTGLLVSNPTSPEEVAEKIMMLLKEPEIASRYGKEGQKLVKERCFFEHFQERFWAQINQNRRKKS